MKFSYLRLAEFAAATIVSSAVLLVAVTPAVIGAPVRLGEVNTSYVQVHEGAPGASVTATLKA